MGTKLNPGKHDCYAKALPDEPMFVLLARDADAPPLVEEWALKLAASARGIVLSDGRSKATEKYTEAMDCAASMRTWRKANPRPDGGYPMPEPDHPAIAAGYFRDIDGTGSMHPCAKDDPGAVPLYFTPGDAARYSAGEVPSVTISAPDYALAMSIEERDTVAYGLMHMARMAYEGGKPASMAWQEITGINAILRQMGMREVPLPPEWSVSAETLEKSLKDFGWVP